MMREVFLSKSGQPFIVSGSGTLAMDMAAANLIEPGDRVLVLETGYFGNRFASILDRYGAKVDRIKAPLGDSIDADAVARELKAEHYKLLTATHVDTSTGVVVDLKPISDLAHEQETLVIVDGVCSVAGEELRQEEWDIDIVVTASQKAISVPPGLALLMVNRRAMEVWRSRKTPVLNYYADFANWLPIMQSYEARVPSYFATPAVNLIDALHESLRLILEEGMEARFKRHKLLGDGMQEALEALGLKQVPVRRDIAASTLSAPYYPSGVDGPSLLRRINAKGVILAGGLHPEIKSRYFRIGHMGPTSPHEIIQVISTLEVSLKECGYKFDIGEGISAAERKFTDE
jgi:alanine-glyoxylate transaminase/serine-glyoxylate transaminase/serine-pyruvate transaminase